MKNKITITTLAALAGLAGAANAQTYSADFSNDGEGATHSGSGTFATGSFDGTNWTSSWPGVSTDSTTNSFITTGGQMVVSDWGGDGTLISDVINITTTGTFTFSGVAVTDSSGDAFNASSEGFEWFYSINSGSEVSFGGVGQGFGGVNVGDGFDLSDSVSGIAITAGDTLEVGFNFNVNGASDGFNVSSMSVSAVPEPSAFGLIAGMLGFTWVMLRRRG